MLQPRRTIRLTGALAIVHHRTLPRRWYTYTQSGQSVWVAGLLPETAPTVMSGDVFYYEDMQFGVFNPATNRSFRTGARHLSILTGVITLSSYNGTLTYEDGEGFWQGSIPITKLASFLGVNCSTGTVSE